MISIHYHPDKANVITNALSLKSGGSLAALITQQPRLLRDLEKMQIKLN